MSVFVMSDEFFNQLVAELKGRQIDKQSYPVFHAVNKYLMAEEASVQKIVQGLRSLNCLAHDTLYINTPDNEIYQVKNSLSCVKWSQVQFIKHLQCLLYQMAEGEIPSHPKFKNLQALVLDLCKALVETSVEWKAANWGG